MIHTELEKMLIRALQHVLPYCRHDEMCDVRTGKGVCSCKFNLHGGNADTILEKAKKCERNELKEKHP